MTEQNNTYAVGHAHLTSALFEAHEELERRGFAFSADAVRDLARLLNDANGTVLRVVADALTRPVAEHLRGRLAQWDTLTFRGQVDAWLDANGGQES